MPAVPTQLPDGSMGIQDSSTGQMFSVQGNSVVPFQGSPAPQAPPQTPGIDVPLQTPPSQLINPAPNMMTQQAQQLQYQPPLPEKPEVMENLRSAQERELKGIQMESEAAQKQAAGQLGVLQASIDHQKELAFAEEARSRAFYDNMDKVKTQLDQKISNLETAPVDPHRLFRNADTASQMMASIGVGLGAVGQALAGLGSNPALDILNRAIDRDIDAQKMDIEKRRAVAGLQVNLYGQNMEQFRTELAAREATRAMYLKVADMQLQKIAASTKSDEVKANAMKMSGQVQADIAKSQAAVLHEVGGHTNLQTSVTTRNPKEVVDMINQAIKDPQMADYLKIRQAKTELAVAEKTGNIGPGLLAFMSGAVKGGKMSSVWLDTLNQMGVVDRAKNWAMIQSGNGTKAPLFQKLKTYINGAAGAMERDIQPQYQKITDWSRMIGKQPEDFVSFGPSKLEQLSSQDRRISR